MATSNRDCETWLFAAARAVVERALELGVDFVDTADSYGPGVSERLLREAGAPERAVVATKAGLLREAEGTDRRSAGPPGPARWPVAGPAVRALRASEDSTDPV